MTSEAGKTIPDELRESWLQLPANEREQLERTWQLSEHARGPMPDGAAIRDAERRLLNAVDDRDRDRLDVAGRPPRQRPSAIRRSTVLIVAVAAVGAVLYLAIYRSDPAPTAPSSSSEFMLLLHGEPLEHYPAEEHGKIIGEYVAWARELGRNGRLVAGNELARGGRILSVSGGEMSDRPIERVDLAVSGYFIIAANSMDEAARIAADCPHLKYDGTVEIRQIGSP